MSTVATHPDATPVNAPAHDVPDTRRLVAVVVFAGRSIPVYARRAESLTDAARLCMLPVSKHSSTPVLSQK